ncbi:Tyrosine-protein kinase SYK [Echinococcus granulosus]|uniref:Tyrosine-protein kinase n=1 Tax=Echinococcus granulosus TaxID=6210 RepID=W6UH05_ECHGR|nr:Tyrosine-protein kinase SYK [Echinococcus granulosus]EUB60286.1 Tyrosine-protein kinase SYK [Echinococcus granulosus]
MARPGVGGVRSRRQSGESASISPHSVSYFHGKITRDQAEAALFAHKALEGLFLLRESVHQNYAISICHAPEAKTCSLRTCSTASTPKYTVNEMKSKFSVVRLDTVVLPVLTEGISRKFPGPVELVKHHAVQLDGFLTLARFPLDRPTGESPIVLQGVRSDELEEKLRLKAMEMGLKGPSVTEALAGPMRDHLRYLVLRDLHFLQPWYHDCIRRRESERRLEENGGGNGSFLVRYRKEDGAYVLSLMYEKEPRHYKIEQHLNRLSIEGGQYFETLIEGKHFQKEALTADEERLASLTALEQAHHVSLTLQPPLLEVVVLCDGELASRLIETTTSATTSNHMIDHYHFRQDGLLCKLRKVVAAPDFIRTKQDAVIVHPKVHVKGKSSFLYYRSLATRRVYDNKGSGVKKGNAFFPPTKSVQKEVFKFYTSLNKWSTWFLKRLPWVLAIACIKSTQALCEIPPHNSLKNTGSSINNSKGASHSLPSLASCPFNSATSDNLGGGSPVLRKVCDDVMHASNDLISFNDWPNVTSLLANQDRVFRTLNAYRTDRRCGRAGNGNTAAKIATTVQTATRFYLVCTAQIFACWVAECPTTGLLGVLLSADFMPFHAGNLIRPNANSNATINNNNNIGGGKLPQNNITVKRISAVPVAKFLRPNLPSLQSVNLGYGDGFVHTPFTPVSTEATPTPRPGTVTSSPTSPFSRVRLKPTFTSTSVGTTVTTATTASNTIANEVSQPRPLQASVTCPLIPEVLRATNNSNTGALQRSPTTARFAQAQLPCKFAPNNSLPPESLNFPPIIDALWEEPDGSEDRSQPSSSLVSINVEALPPPPPHILNPFIQRTSSQTSVNLQPCHHAPGVSTFCNSACCQQKHQLQQKQQQQKADEIVVEKIEKEEVSPTKPPSSVLPAIEEAQKIYDSLPDNTLFLQPDSIRLMDRLGGGNFGQVVKAIYKTPQGQEVEVAVKTLRESQIASTGEQTILSEAETMTQLKHRHIVRLIGVCKAQHFMLVLELAPLGPINKYLKKHPDTPVWVLSELMHQVAQGMAYLEACKLVHRDLAARNVLLVTQRFAKVSDFGMSKALNFGNDYYREGVLVILLGSEFHPVCKTLLENREFAGHHAASAGKWPLKWYAPECIYYFRFDSKSDVWSYGITLWEVFSYGERPYKDMKGAQILAMLDQGLRLSRPVRCPEAIYAVMQQCWNAEGVRRPTFAELVLTMSRLAKGPLFPNNFSGCHENERGAGVSGESVGAFAFF